MKTKTERPEKYIASFLAELVAREHRRKTFLAVQSAERGNIFAEKLARAVLPKDQPRPN